MSNLDAKRYRRERGCIGGQHVIPVPPGMAPDEAWSEIVLMGRLVEPSDQCTWATIECQGGPNCECLEVDCAPEYKHFHNDVQVYP